MSVDIETPASPYAGDGQSLNADEDPQARGEVNDWRKENEIRNY